MCVDDPQNLYFRNAFPIQSAIGLTGNLGVVRQQKQATWMFDVHRNLPDAVAGKLVGPQLRQKPKRFQALRRHQVSEPLTDPPAVIRSVFAKNGLFVSQFFGELRANERDLHDSLSELTLRVNNCQHSFLQSDGAAYCVCPQSFGSPDGVHKIEG
jgi:hypothetical protein